MAELITFAADVPQELRETPFLPGQKARLSSTAAANVYGANHPTKVDADKYLAFQGDGTTVAWDDSDFAALAAAHVDGGALATADILRVIVKVGGTVLERVAASATPSAGEFKTSGTTDLTLGDAPDDGQLVEVLILDAADVSQFNAGALTANTPVEVDCTGYVVSDDVAFLEKYFD